MIYVLILSALLTAAEPEELKWATIGTIWTAQFAIDKPEYDSETKSVKFSKKNNDHFDSILVILQRKITNKEETTIMLFFKNESIRVNKALITKMVIHRDKDNVYCTVHWSSP